MLTTHLNRSLFHFLCALFIGLMINQHVQAQFVNNRKCPDTYRRNNGNGQFVTPFASNIPDASIYAKNALTTNNEGVFTFSWKDGIIYPPIITRTLLTSTTGVITQNWIWGNNTLGSPFNPPGIPDNGSVRYNFFNYNLPTAGLVTFEFSDPQNNQLLNTCTYELKYGNPSSGDIYNYPIKSPSNFNYPISVYITSRDSSGESCLPNIDGGGGYITYSLESPISKISIDPITGIISWAQNLPIDTFHIKVVASNGLLPNAITEIVLVVTEKGVCSGHEGGLESKSLGFVLSSRLFENIRNAQHTEIDYKKTLPFLTQLPHEFISINSQNNFRSVSSDSKLKNIKLQDYFPDAYIFGKDTRGFITSPTDIVNFTNAVDVMSVDYVQHGLNKGVAFSTKSINQVYTHTKPVCDRLKGSELLKVETVVIRNHKFLKYTIKPSSGIVEYATSFSVGVDPASDRLILQSKWLTEQYVSHDLMVNFQFWSYDAQYLNDMINNVMLKFEHEFSISSSGNLTPPPIYIQSLYKDGNEQYKLRLKVFNNTSAVSATMMVKSKKTELDSIGKQTVFPIQLIPFGTSDIKIPLNDVSESEIRLLINGVQEDYVYYNDGLWNIHYPSTTSLSSFDISTDTIMPRIDEFRLFRNIKLSAITSEYVTIYKMLRGGAMPMNLSDFNALKFEAIGNSPVRVRMLKKSVLNFDEQYEYLLALSPTLKTYQINLNQFNSSKFKRPINPDDVLILSFTFEAAKPSSRIESSIKHVRFVKAPIQGSLQPQRMIISPNPVTSQFSISFQSDFTEQMNLHLIDISTGRLIHEQNFNVVKGYNNIKVQSIDLITNAFCIVRLSSSNQVFQAKIIKTE
ncbi:MAG: hypothetical protein ACOVQS_07300 [Chitinophagaceae bacterium]